jgi:hypothetical protein
MRSLWLTLTFAMTAFFFAAGATAQDGLQRFEKDIKPQIELKSFTYGGASAIGSNGFVLNNVVAVVPGSAATGGKDTTIKIDKVTADEVDFDRMKGASDDVPRFMKIKLEGINGDDDLFAQLAPFGVPKVPVDFTLDYRLDGPSKVLTLSKLEINLRGQSRIALSLIMDGISDKMSEAQGAKDTGRLRNASLDIDDTGLLAKVLPAAAQMQGATPEALVTMALAPIAAFTANQGAPTLKALDAVASFITDWKKPNGPIKVSIKPAKSASVNDLDKVGQPNALVDIFGLSVDYAGTRAGAASGGGGQTASAAPSGGGDDKPLKGAEAGMSLVGNTLAGKYDGGMTYELYNKDGSSVFLDDDNTKAKGKWSIEGEKVCTKYKGDDKDCYAIERVGDKVTLTEKGGKTHKMTVMPGNPKDL